MRKILLWIFISAFAAFTSGPARGQEDAAQQQIDQINGRIQDLVDAQTAQGKRLAALEKSIGDLQDKLSQPAVNNNASADDLKKLAEQVKEIDRNRQEDNKKILDTLDKLGKAGGAATSHKPPVVSNDNPTAVAGDKQNGYWQPVGSGDTIIAIAKAYQDKGVKVTVKQIMDANPGLDPKNLKVGQKIWIPDPSAK